MHVLLPCQCVSICPPLCSHCLSVLSLTAVWSSVEKTLKIEGSGTSVLHCSVSFRVRTAVCFWGCSLWQSLYQSNPLPKLSGEQVGTSSWILSLKLAALLCVSWLGLEEPYLFSTCLVGSSDDIQVGVLWACGGRNNSF